MNALDEIRKRAEAATPGPYLSDYCGDVWSLTDMQECPSCFHSFGTKIGTTKKGPGEDDANFIACAREDIPRLVAALEKAIEQRDYLIMDICAYRFDEDSTCYKFERNAEIEAILHGTGKPDKKEVVRAETSLQLSGKEYLRLKEEK